MRNIVLIIEYDGTDFLGWQTQAAGRTVQGTVEAALRTILQEEIRLIAAGRTDTGVHAVGQVANFRTRSLIPLDRLRSALNSVLQDDVVIHDAHEVDEQFHARYSATERLYRYRLLRQPSALRHRYAWYIGYPLDTAAMVRASEVLVGVHDFTSFCQADPGRSGARCHVRWLHWQEIEDELLLDIEADRFLHHMVRTIVGTAVDIGRGRHAPEEMACMLSARDRRTAGRTAPARGLCLIRVTYPSDECRMMNAE